MATSGGVSTEKAHAGTWKVGGAGEVEFQANDGSLNLVNVSPNSGWKQRMVDEEPDEIKVRFAKRDTAWRFEAEISWGQVKLEVSQKATG